MNNGNWRFTYGDKAEAVDIIREAARWLIDTGKPMWLMEELTDERLKNPPGEFVVCWDGDRSAAAAILSFHDPFFWPDIPPDTSGFIHKLSVRRAYAGRGVAAMLVEEAKRACLQKGIRYLRLDTDPHREGLMAFYRNCGFQLREIKVLDHPRLGKIDLAMFEADCLGDIRPVSPDDFAEIAAMIRECFAAVAEAFGITAENGPTHTSFITAEKLQAHHGWGWLMVGLYEGEQLAGYVSLSDEGGGVFELHNIAVRPECRHKGYGKRLLDFCKAKTAERGGKVLKLSHIEENTTLKDWYLAHGFRHTGTRTFSHLPFTAGYMEWEVTVS